MPSLYDVLSQQRDVFDMPMQNTNRPSGPIMEALASMMGRMQEAPQMAPTPEQMARMAQAARFNPNPNRTPMIESALTASQYTE